jgi:hypothetical protein
VEDLADLDLGRGPGQGVAAARAPDALDQPIAEALRSRTWNTLPVNNQNPGYLDFNTQREPGRVHDAGR